MAGTNGQGTAAEIAEVVRQVLAEVLPLQPAQPISAYVLVVTKDDKTFQGALVGNSMDQPCIELRGAQIAEFSTAGEMRWKVLDWPVFIYRQDVSYIQRRP